MVLLQTSQKGEKTASVFGQSYPCRCRHRVSVQQRRRFRLRQL